MTSFVTVNAPVFDTSSVDHLCAKHRNTSANGEIYNVSGRVQKVKLKHYHNMLQSKPETVCGTLIRYVKFGTFVDIMNPVI